MDRFFSWIGVVGMVVFWSVVGLEGGEGPLRCRLLRVVDGDTVVVQYYRLAGIKVRLLGIDAPESRPNRRARLQAQHYRKSLKQILAEGRAATAHLRQLLRGCKWVYLTFDSHNRRYYHWDRYNRLLAYLYTGGGRFINLQMVRDGYAYLLEGYRLEGRYWRALVRGYREARGAHRGIWGERWERRNWRGEGGRVAESRLGKWRCGRKRKKCTEMRSCEEAYFYYRVCGVKGLDRDRDGVPCENLCGRKRGF